jgi:hypothetical protein
MDRHKAYQHRAFQTLLIISTIAFSWLAMIGLHETGHVLHAVASGGRVARVVLEPTVHARTELAENPHPLFVAWGGGVWGTLIPLAAWANLRVARNQGAWLAAFFAGFCAVANGTYLGVGAFFPAGDSADLLNRGAAAWQLLLFGAPVTALGFYLWNGLGPHFGLGEAAPHIDRKAALGMALATVLVATIEWIVSG